MRKPSIGRQKIEMKKIESSDALQVCLSKRRAGLFKKANELSVLCGAEIAVIVFSPAGKPFSYGHPSVDSVVDRYLSGVGSSRMVGSDRRWAVGGGGIIQMHAEMTNMLDSSKKLKARLEAEMESRRWDGNVEGLGLEDLETLRRALEDLKEKVVNHGIGIVGQHKPEPVNFAPPNYNYCNIDVGSYGGSGMISGNGFLMPPPFHHGSYNNDGNLMALLPPPPDPVHGYNVDGYNNPLADGGGFNYGFGI